MDYRKLFVGAAAVLASAVSCSDEAKSPIDFDKAVNNNGGFIRHIDVASATFDLFDISGSEFVVTVEAVDGKQGQEFEEIEFLVTFDDNTPDNGTITKAEASVKTVAASEFEIDEESGLPRATVTITANEALAALGMVEGDLAGGDSFIFREVMRMPDGTEFSHDNSSGDITGGAFFSSPFRTVVTVVCPSELAITYDAHTDWVDYYGDPGSNDFEETFVQHTNAAGTPIPGQYRITDLSGGMEPIIWGSPAVAAVIADACGTIGLVSAPYSYPYFILDGSVDPVTGVITIDWENFYGEGGTTVYTPQ